MFYEKQLQINYKLKELYNKVKDIPDGESEILFSITNKNTDSMWITVHKTGELINPKTLETQVGIFICSYWGKNANEPDSKIETKYVIIIDKDTKEFIKEREEN